jgi:hypothetical protein
MNSLQAVEQALSHAGFESSVCTSVEIRFDGNKHYIDIASIYHLPIPVRGHALVHFFLNSELLVRNWVFHLNAKQKHTPEFLRPPEYYSKTHEVTIPVEKDSLVTFLAQYDITVSYHNIRKKKQRIPHTLKKKVWDNKYGMAIGRAICDCCGITPIQQMSFHCGHIESEARGGKTEVDNLIPICQSCNSSMGTKNYYEFKKSLQSSIS